MCDDGIRTRAYEIEILVEFFFYEGHSLYNKQKDEMTIISADK